MKRAAFLLLVHDLNAAITNGYADQLREMTVEEQYQDLLDCDVDWLLEYDKEDVLSAIRWWRKEQGWEE